MYPIQAHQEVKLGTVQLNVANVEQSLHFYRDILGLKVTARLGTLVFLSTNGHRRIILDTWNENEARAPVGHHGFYHFSVLFLFKKPLGRVVKRLIDAAVPVE